MQCVSTPRAYLKVAERHNFMRELNIMTTPKHQPVETGGRPTISACLIVKNEEKFLPQCLESIKNAVDEIIIVDTGSTDRTVEIAKSYGAKVYHHPWRNSFSEARNHSLSYATCDWILQIDADESLEQADIPLLHSLIRTDSHNAILVAIYSTLPGGQSKHYFTRVFRRGKARFEGLCTISLSLRAMRINLKFEFSITDITYPETEMQKNTNGRETYYDNNWPKTQTMPLPWQISSETTETRVTMIRLSNCARWV